MVIQLATTFKSLLTFRQLLFYKYLKTFLLCLRVVLPFTLQSNPWHPQIVYTIYDKYLILQNKFINC